MLKGDKLSASDELLAISIASGKSVSDAAVDAGMTTRCAYSKTRLPIFKKFVQEFRQETVSRISGKLIVGMTMATEELIQQISSDSQIVRYRAADKLLQYGLKSQEIFRLEEEIRELRAMVEELTQVRNGEPK